MSNDQNPSIDLVIKDVLVHLVRQVPWGPSRSELETEAAALRQKAMWERGMCDNYSTADWLHWEADLYQLAAEGRFPRENDQQVSLITEQVSDALKVEFSQIPDTDNACDVTGNSRVLAAVKNVLEGYDPGTKKSLEATLRQRRGGHVNREDTVKRRHN